MVSLAPSLPAEHRAAVVELLREPGVACAQAGFRVTVRGACMTPTLRDGQVVQVWPRRWALPGDIVAFERGAADPGLAVHRLLGVRPARSGLVWVTQADNERAPDPAFARDRLVGVADVRVSLMDHARAVRRWLPALLAPVTRRLRLGGLARGARREAVPVSSSASR